MPQLLETAARRAETEGLELETQEADAQALPFADGEFDVVLSTFGVMFAPDQSRAAVRTAAGLPPRRPHRPDRVDTGQRHGRHPGHRRTVRAAPAPAPAARSSGAPRPGSASSSAMASSELTAQVLSTDMCGISPAARVEFNRTYVGPTKALFDRLGPDAQQALAAELASCLDRFNRATDGTLVAPADYLQVVATRAAG